MGKIKVKLTKKQVLTGVGVVVLLLAAAGAGFLVQWLSNQNKGGQQGQDGTNNGQVVVEDPRLQGTLQEIQQLREQGNTQEANKKIDEGLKNSATSNDDKYILYLQKGSALIDAGKPAEAAAEFEKARTIKETFEIMNILADAYRLAGNNAKAVEAYKKTLQLLPQDHTTYEAQKAALEQTIRNLGGQP